MADTDKLVKVGQLDTIVDEIVDKFGETNGRLHDLVTPSTNILNPDNILPGHFYKIVTVDGRAHIEAQENSAFSCAYVDVTPGTDYVATGISYNAYTASADRYAVGIAYTASSSVSAPVFDSDAYNANYGNGDKTISRIYFSFRNGTYPTDTMMVVEGTTLPDSYIPYGVDLNRQIGVHWSQIKDAPETDARKIYTVDINGSGDYTSFTACLEVLKDDESPKTIYVKAGTYDIFAELGGQTYAESISGQGYQWFDISVVVPPNTRIIGIGEVVLEFKPTAAQIPSDVASLLSPVNVIYDIYMENITIDADNCRYCIHDETGHIDGVVETRHIYKNVKLIKKRTNVGMDAAFGCGMQRGQYMEFDGCIFSAPNRPFSFHNKGTTGYVDGTIIVIKNSVALTANNGNALRFGNVNGKQVKIDARVLNSYLAGQIIVLNESSTERPNAYALTVVRCGNPTVTVENATNIYPPVVYA